MSTTRAVVASLLGVALALVLGVAGAVAIYHTRDGQVQGNDSPEVQFPATPTGAIAVLDDAGTLASLAVVALRPTADGDEPGTGGTIVPVPVSADVSGGSGAERLPLDETVELFGAESLADEVPALLGVRIDDLAAVTRRELASMFADLPPIDVTLPAAVTGPDGSFLAEAGAQTIDAAAAADILASRAAGVSGAEDYVVDVAVWKGIADAIGAGHAVPDGVAGRAGPASVTEILSRLTSGPVSVQALRSESVASVDLNPRGVDALALDRVEVALVFGHITPGRVAAPYAGYTYRIVSSFGDSQLPAGVARLDVAYTAVKAVLATEANVRSVDTSPGEAESVTLLEVANDSLVGAAERLTDTFGPVDVRVAGTRIAGIDIVVTLGTDYLATLDTSVAGSTVPDGSLPGGTVGADTAVPEGADSMAEGTS